jgi:hypothetical protein
MKKLFKFFIVFSLIFLSCEEDEKSIFNAEKDGSLLSFTKGTTADFSVANVADPFKLIEVGVTKSESFDRTFSINVDPASTATATQYEIVQSTLVIPANSYLGFIKVKSFYNTVTPVKKSLILNLVNINSGKVANFANKYTLNIFQSCPKGVLDLAMYDVDVTAFNSNAPSHVQQFRAVSGQENTFDIDSSWGPTFVGWATGSSSNNNQYLYKGRIKINCDNTVTFTGTDSWATGGTGTFNPTTKELSIVVGQTLFTTAFTATCFFTPQ